MAEELIERARVDTGKRFPRCRGDNRIYVRHRTRGGQANESWEFARTFTMWCMISKWFRLLVRNRMGRWAKGTVSVWDAIGGAHGSMSEIAKGIVFGFT